ncbi:MAG: 3-oxoacyl-[acyl-carrier-protein] synthase III C-terminal domain-containing protein [Verrucomicrobiota bacterium]
MYLSAIHHAVPEYSLKQSDLWEEIKDLKQVHGLESKSQNLLERILLGDNGIQKRHFASADVKTLMSSDAGKLNLFFQREATKLGVQSLGPALDQSSIDANQLDALFVCTCSGYLCPGLSSYIAEQLALPDHIQMADLVGLGCGAAIPTLRNAWNYLKANPHSNAAVIAVEVCSAAFYLDDDPGVLVSFCLFGDGASASVWTGEEIGYNGGSCIECKQFDSLHIPKEREKLRFENVKGKLRNKLHRSIPGLAAEAVEELFLSRSCKEEPDKIVIHPGGKKVLQAVENQINIRRPVESYEVLSDYGNMSSPSVLFGLEFALRNLDQNSGKIWMSSFGAGLTAYCCEMEIH